MTIPPWSPGWDVATLEAKAAALERNKIRAELRRELVASPVATIADLLGGQVVAVQLQRHPAFRPSRLSVDPTERKTAA